MLVGLAILFYLKFPVICHCSSKVFPYAIDDSLYLSLRKASNAFPAGGNV